MTALESFIGRYKVELSSGDVSELLNRTAQLDLQLRDVLWVDDITVQLIVSAGEYKKLVSLVQRHGAKLEIISREGYYWAAWNLLKRPVFLVGVIFLLVVGALLPGRILFVQVQGNDRVEATRILESASEFGIRFGASRRLVRSEQVKNQLIGAIPELGWVGVNTKGCVAVISVREKELQVPVITDTEPCNVIALRGGVVLNCSATRGKLLCQVGQAVSEGDILISGRDSLLTIDTITGASGEIFASTQRQFSVQTPDLCGARGEKYVHKIKFSLQIGKNLINFFKGSGICGSSCVKMYSKYVLTLPGGFTLPVALVKWIVEPWGISQKAIAEEDAQMLLTDFASGYLMDQMIAGQIIRKDETLTQSDGVFQLTGDYACTEMIGRAQKEQIGANHGKTD